MLGTGEPVEQEVVAQAEVALVAAELAQVAWAQLRELALVLVLGPELSLAQVVKVALRPPARARCLPRALPVWALQPQVLRGYG